jgi:hypothetical protein
VAVVAHFSHAFHFNVAMFTLGAVGEKVMAVSRTVPSIFNLVNKVLKPGTRQTLLLPLERVLFLRISSFYLPEGASIWEESNFPKDLSGGLRIDL